MLSKFLDPKNDVAFKKIFGTPKNQDILIHFLNDMLVFKGGRLITKVNFLKTIQEPDIAAKKTSIVDIMCADEIGNQYIVEMQIADADDFIKRAQYYAAKAYSSQLKVSEGYANLKEIIFLAITNFVMFPDKKEFKSDHVVLDRLTFEHDLQDFSFTFLELPKFEKSKHELKTVIDRWSYFFKHAKETTQKDLAEIIGNEAIIKRAYEELDKFGWSEEELLTYEAEVKREMDERSILTRRYNVGKVDGKIESKIEIAQKLIKKNMTAEDIADLTGLTEQEIKELKMTKE